MYVHESISVKEILRSSQGGAGNFRPEILFIELSLGQSKILCGTVYNAPDAAHWSDVDEALLNCKNPYDFTIIMGDFNINWLNPSATLKILRDFLLSFNLDRVPFDATHHRDCNDSHTAIDYICVSDLSMVTSFKQEHQPAISEHDLLFASLAFPVSHRVPAAITRRSYKSFCLDHFQNDLSKLDWQTLAALPNIDSKVENFSEGLLLYVTPMHLFTRLSPRRITSLGLLQILKILPPSVIKPGNFINDEEVLTLVLGTIYSATVLKLKSKMQNTISSNLNC